MKTRVAIAAGIIIVAPFVGALLTIGVAAVCGYSRSECAPAAAWVAGTFEFFAIMLVGPVMLA